MTDTEQRAQYECDAQSLGMSLADFMAAMPPPDRSRPDSLPIWRDNLPILKLFVSLRTQWRILVGAERAFYLGLDYAAVEVAMRRNRLEDSVFGDIQAMEWAALEVLNE